MLFFLFVVCTWLLFLQHFLLLFSDNRKSNLGKRKATPSNLSPSQKIIRGPSDDSCPALSVKYSNGLFFLAFIRGSDIMEFTAWIHEGQYKDMMSIDWVSDCEIMVLMGLIWVWKFKRTFSNLIYVFSLLLLQGWNISITNFNLQNSRKVKFANMVLLQAISIQQSLAQKVDKYFVQRYNFLVSTLEASIFFLHLV